MAVSDRPDPGAAPAPLRFRVPSAIRWRPYGDGIVVLVPATCETHVLAPELEPLFAPGAVLTDGQETGPVDSLWVQAPRAVLLHLAGLKILEAVA